MLVLTLELKSKKSRTVPRHRFWLHIAKSKGSLKRRDDFDFDIVILFFSVFGW